MNYTQLKKLVKNSKCTRCDLHSGAQSVCILGYGKIPADVMIVGEAPSLRAQCDIEKPFAGKCGQILERVLLKCKSPREGVFITNAVHCYIPQDIKPKSKHIEACRYYLLKEIYYVKPKKIICLGNIASRSILNDMKVKISDLRNKKITKTFFSRNVEIYFTFHPGTALKSPHMEDYILEDFYKALNFKNITEGLGKTSYKDYKPGSILRHEEKLVSLDIETNDSLEPFNPTSKVVSLAVSYKPHTAIFAESKQIKRLMRELDVNRGT